MMQTATLTREQEQIVNLPLGSWLVTAPPGCGKTEVLIRRVEHLLQMSGRRRSRVLVLTFTRRAAENVIERVRRALPDHAERVVANRFHQFCHEVLRQQAPDKLRNLYAGKPERLLALHQALAEEGLAPGDNGTLEGILQHIERIKKTLAFEQPEGIGDESLSAAFDVYVRYQQRERICDYDDLILDALELFRADDWRVLAYRQRYESVLVDEAQDLNASQYALVTTLVGPVPRDIMLLADRRQSIYAFNGADLGLLDRFITDFHAEQRSLTLSFRCGRRIVDAANAVAQTLQRTPDLLQTNVVFAEGRVEVAALSDQNDEASWVINRVSDLLANGLPAELCHPGERLSLDPHEIAVLGRSRRSLIAIEDGLRSQFGQVVTSYGRDDSLASSMGQTALWLLRSIAHPDDAIIRRQFLAHVVPEQRPEEIRSLRDAVLAICHSSVAAVAQLGRLALSAHQESEIVFRVLEVLENVSLAGGEEAETLASDVDWLARIRTQIRRKLQREPTVTEFVQEISMSSSTAVEGPGVRVLTIHAAKGQEFRVVALVGVQHGTFPSYFARSPRMLDEERRLLYVAITRASRLLLVSRARTLVTRSGNRISVPPSPFFLDLQMLRDNP